MARPAEPRVTVRRAAVRHAMLELTTTYIAPRPGAVNAGRSNRQGSRSEYLPELKAAQILAHVSKVPRPRRTARTKGALPSDTMQWLRDAGVQYRIGDVDALSRELRAAVAGRFLAGYAPEAVNRVLDALAEVAAIIPPGLSVATVRSYCQKRG